MSCTSRYTLKVHTLASSRCGLCQCTKSAGADRRCRPLLYDCTYPGKYLLVVRTGSRQCSAYFSHTGNNTQTCDLDHWAILLFLFVSFVVCTSLASWRMNGIDKKQYQWWFGHLEQERQEESWKLLLLYAVLAHQVMYATTRAAMMMLMLEMAATKKTQESSWRAVAMIYF